MTAHLLKHKFMNAGSAPNGDWFVIDFSTEACVPGFITHEEWSQWSDEPQNPRQFFQPMARTFDTLLYRVVEGRYLPTDYYAAQEFNAFLDGEQNAYPCAAANPASVLWLQSEHPADRVTELGCSTIREVT